MRREFTEAQIKARAGEDFLDALHNDGVLESFHAGLISKQEMADRIEYIASRNTFEAAQERMEREAEYAFEECS